MVERSLQLQLLQLQYYKDDNKDETDINGWQEREGGEGELASLLERRW